MNKIIAVVEKKYFLVLVLLFIILFAFVSRIYNLDSNPTGFFADEASIGINAYSILKKGVDEYGTNWPIFFRAFDEYKSPIQIYSTVPFIYILGLSEFSVRLASVFWGVASIVAIFFLARVIDKTNSYHQNELTGILSALLIAISPWHFHIGRIAFEQMPFIFGTALGTYFFLRQSKRGDILLSVFIFALTIYTYFPARIFIPLYVFALFIIFAKNLLHMKREVVVAIFIGFIICIPFILHSISQQGVERWRQVSVFNLNTIEDAPKHIINNYISHFSLDFLFTKGDIDLDGQFISRHSVRGFGELYLFQLPFIILGGIYLLLIKRFKEFCALLTWIILYPTGSMFTQDAGAQATRSIIGVVPFTILTALGIVYLYDLIRHTLISRVIIISLLLLMIFSFFSYYFKFHVEYPTYSSDVWGWQAGFKDSYFSLIRDGQNFDELLITHRFNRGDALLNFYNINYSCQKCKIISNPISIDTNKHQLFALRNEDIEEAKELYPNLQFNKINSIAPVDQEELYIGQFLIK